MKRYRLKKKQRSRRRRDRFRDYLRDEMEVDRFF